MSLSPARLRSPTGLALVEEGNLRIAPIRPLPGLITEMGLDAGQVITESGLSPTIFDDPENTIPFADVGRLLGHCASRTRCPHLGLLIGQRAGLEVLGVVGRLAGHSPDLGSALRNIILYLHLHDRGAVPALWESGDRAMFVYTIYQPEVPGTEQIYDGALAIIYNIMKILAGPSWEAIEVRLCRPRPAEIEPYRRVYRSRLCFGADYHAVVFPASCLARPIGGADEQSHWRIMQEIQNLEAQGAGDLVAQLRRILRRLLISGAGQGETSLDQIAKLFTIHRRTLNRRLRAQDTSFKALIDTTRYDIARQLLRDTRLPISEVAATLDYSEAAAFDRAFRRWSGTSPTAWRATNTPVWFGQPLRVGSEIPPILPHGLPLAPDCREMSIPKSMQSRYSYSDHE